MTIFNSATITGPPHFDPAGYPLVINELNDLSEKFRDLPANHKADMLISYLKDHAIRAIWVNDNPETAKLVVSGRFATDQIEKLFTSNKQNTGFLREFEACFRSRFQEI